MLQLIYFISIETCGIVVIYVGLQSVLYSPNTRNLYESQELIFHLLIFFSPLSVLLFALALLVFNCTFYFSVLCFYIE